MANLQKSNQDAVYKAISADTGVSTDRIQQFMKEKGITDPSQLAGDESLLVELMEGGKGAIEPATPSKPAKGRGRKPKQAPQAPPNFDEAINHAAKQSAAEINAFRGALTVGKQQWVEHTANTIVDELRSAPEEVVAMVAEYAMEEQADADFFRSKGEQFAATLFAIS